MDVNLAVSWLIKDLESVDEVKVGLVGKVDLGGLDFLFEVALFFERVDEFILLVEWKDWLS